MPKLTDQQDADRQYDPYSNEDARNLYRQETGNDAGVKAGIDQAESFANDPKNPSKNIDAVREKEGQFGYKPDASNTPEAKSFLFRGKALLGSRKGATGGIIGLILALIGFGSLLLTPGLAAVQMKEILTDDLNDQLAAMDIRSNYVMRAKLKDLGKGSCVGIKIRCGFKGMSDRQIKKFEKAGITVETKGKVLGRNHVTSLSLKDSKGNTITVDNPRQLNRLLGDRIVRNTFRKAFNPKFAGFFDAKWDNFKKRYNLTSSDKLGPGDEDEKNKAVTSAVQGEPIQPEVGNPTRTNENGEPDPRNGDATKASDRATSGVSNGGPSTSSFLSSGASSAVKGVGVLGYADLACTVKNTARAVEAGAKIYRQKQLIAYSSVFLTFADQVKAGNATPEQAEWVGNKLTAIDSSKIVPDENNSNRETGELKTMANPYYGANAFDSAGYKTAMYNEAPTLSARDMQMAVGGGIPLATLSKVNEVIEKYASGDETCDVIQSWEVRATSLVVGVALGVVTVGGSLAVSVAASAAIGAVIPILENYLAQMTAGTVANGDTKGVDTGNAMFAGTASIMGGMAAARGMKPASKEDMKAYLALSDEVKSEYIAMEAADGKSNPLDTNNRYSFMGSLARTLLPLKTTSSVSLGNSFMNSLGFLSTATNISPTAAAKNGYNEERYSKCKDEGYKELQIDADVFCNVRFVMSNYELSLDSEEVRAQMLTWGQVNDDEEGSVVSDSTYQKWLTECTERTVGWGAETGENTDDTGEICIKAKGEISEMMLSYFRVYTMDQSIIAAMDYEPPTGGTSPDSSGAGTEFTVSSYNVETIKNQAWPARIEKSTSNIKEKQFDVVGVQENAREPMYKMFKSKLSDQYEFYPEPKFDRNPNPDHGKSILWRKEKFTFVKGEIVDFPAISHPGRSGKGKIIGPFPNPAGAPLVWLKDNTTGQVVAFMNTHNAAFPSWADDRANAGDKYIQRIEQLRKEGVSVVFTGDFNEGTGVRRSGNTTLGGNRANLMYCKFAANKLMKNAGDTAASKETTCNDGKGKGGVDYIYHSPDIRVKGIGTIARGASGSDHAAIYARLQVPGDGSTSDIAWPVDKKHWDDDREDFLGPHSAISGTWTNRIDSLAADIGNPPDGSPVYAMFGGTVSRPDLRSSVGGLHGLAIETDIQGGKLEIAYAHGPRVDRKTTYKAGDKIMTIGCLGNCDGGHLHMDIAFNGKGVCPQDVFIAMARGQTPNFSQLTTKAAAPCGR